MTIAETIQQSIQKALESLNISDVSFVVEHPSDLDHGDYATNVALAASKSTQKNPREVAEMIVNEIKKQVIPEISDITIAGPGFINFTLAPEFFNQSIAEILDHEKDFGNVSAHAGKKILVEHSSPNLFKPFHIGHMMNNAIGESLTRLMQSSGADVTTMSFPSDISLGIAKAVVTATEYYPDQESWNNFISMPDGFKDILISMGHWYVSGTAKYENDESFQLKVKDATNKLFNKIPSRELEVYEFCKKINIEYFEEITKQLGSHFDSYIYESESGEVGKKIVLEHTPSIFTESEGAIVYIPDESKKNLNTSVFINSQGNPTYDAKDLGLLSMKFEIHHPDVSVFVTDHEQIPHFNIVLDAAEKIHPEWKEKSIHVPHGRMSFKGQKMSSRLGGVPLAADMIDAVSEEVSEASAERDIDEKTKSDIAIAAIKFSILRAKPGMNINFDPETSLSFEGDSGPYLQYTHARIQTLIEKGKEQGINSELKSGVEVSELEKIMYRFPEVVELAITEYAPNYIVTYLLEVARSFNSFYGSHKIIDTDNREVSAHRIAIARSAQIIIKNGLWMLGINAPDRM